MNLQKHTAKICYTAAGLLVCERKVLFIKHKKIGIWFAPGGHIDPNELPHRAAEREFWEETGVRVRAIDPYFDINHQTKRSKDSEYLPSPIETNLHWVSEENYKKRLASSNQEKRAQSKIWKLGCEQHIGNLYLVEAIDESGKPLHKISDISFKQNVEETDGIAWFSLDELNEIETNDDIRQEVAHALRIIDQSLLCKKIGKGAHKK